MGGEPMRRRQPATTQTARARDRKSTRLNSSQTIISYAVFCLKKKGEPSWESYDFLESYIARRKRVPKPKGKTSGPVEDVFFFLMIGRPPGFPLLPTRRSSD